MCIKSRFCEIVANRRKGLGLTQRAIALKLDVTTQHISNVETGRTVPSDRFCLKLAKILKMDPELMILSNHREKACHRIKHFFTNAIIDYKRRVRRATGSG